MRSATTRRSRTWSSGSATRTGACASRRSSGSPRARIRTRPRSELIAALADGENPGRRNSAVEALVAIGARAVAALVAACSDEDADVRKFVVDALAGIGSEAATDALCARLADPDANVRAAAADALGAVGGATARAALRATATDAAQDPLVRFSALHALDTLEEPMRADELAGVLGDPMLGPAGLALLGRCEGDPMALDVLLKGLASGVRAARESSMRGVLRLAARLDGAALGELAARLDEVSRAAPNITSSAIAHLPEADLGTQLALVQFLGLLRARSAVVPILEVGRDEALAQVALGALAEIGPAAAEELDAAWTLPLAGAPARRVRGARTRRRPARGRAPDRGARRRRSDAARRRGARDRRTARREGARAARAPARVRGARGRSRRRGRARRAVSTRSSRWRGPTPTAARPRSPRARSSCSRAR